MALRVVGPGEARPGLLTTEAQPISTYKATTPLVGDFVRVQNSGGLAIGVNSMAAAASLHTAQFPWGIVKNVPRDSTVITVEWHNVKGIQQYTSSGTVTVGQGLVHVNTARNNKVSGTATVALTPKPFVVAVDSPASGQVQAFLI